MFKTKCNIEDQWSITDYLGVNIQYMNENIKLSQPRLIDQIIEDVNISPNSSDEQMPALWTAILPEDLDLTKHLTTAQW